MPNQLRTLIDEQQRAFSAICDHFRHEYGVEVDNETLHGFATLLLDSQEQSEAAKPSQDPNALTPDQVSEAYIADHCTCPFCQGSIQATGESSDDDIKCFRKTFSLTCGAEFTEVLHLVAVDVDTPPIELCASTKEYRP